MGDGDQDTATPKKAGRPRKGDAYVPYDEIDSLRRALTASPRK